MQTSYLTKALLRMSEYQKRQDIVKMIYCVSARPTGFWRRRMGWLPYNVGQKVQLEVAVESRRERGLAWMDLTYFKFIEIMPGEAPRIVELDKSRITLSKGKGFIYPVTTQMRNVARAGYVEYRLLDEINHEEVVLFSDETVFLHSSKNVIGYASFVVGVVVGVVVGIASTLLTQWMNRFFR